MLHAVTSHLRHVAGLPGLLLVIVALAFFAGCNKNSAPTGPGLNLNNPWSQVATPTEVYALAADGSTLYASCYAAGIIRTTDDGLSWSNVCAGVDSTPVVALTAANGSVYAATQVGIYVSKDRGSYWTLRKRIAGISLLYVQGASVLAATNTGVYKSSDDGVTWTPATSGLSSRTATAFTSIRSDLFAATALVMFPPDELLYGLFHSTNSGAQWIITSDDLHDSGLPQSPVPVLAAFDTTLFAASGAGIYASSDRGVTFSACNLGLNRTHIFALLASGNMLFCAAEDNIYAWMGFDFGWTPLPGGPPVANAAGLAVSGNYLWTASANGQLYQRQLY